jgi:hypothetical protein
MTVRRKTSRPHGGRARGALALAVGIAATAAGCDNALSVELPGQITLDDTFVASQAEVLVASAIADIECGLTDFIAFNAAGAEDVATKTTGWYGSSLQYDASPGGTCHGSSTALGSFISLQKGRWMAEQTYEKLGEWTDAEVANRAQLQATAAIYVGLTYTFFGELYCEISANTGPLLSWQQSLEAAEEWYTKALTHIAGADFAIPSGVTSSAQQMAYLLRARTRLAMDDPSGAAEDAERVQQGFVAWITRDGGGEQRRWNRVYANQILTNGWVSVVGPVNSWVGSGQPDATGKVWPAVIPFTGYWDLGISADGRAVTADELPVTTTTDPAAVADTRVPVVPTGSVGGPRRYPIYISEKYVGEEADIPLAKWEEAWLIIAQAKGGQEAIDRVNAIRDDAGLPRVTYLTAGDAAGIEDLIIEEIRREHFLEGRFWPAKLRYDLWFPRGVGQDNWGQPYSTGVRLVMPSNEFVLNPNLDESQRGSMCSADQNPVS